MRVRKDILDPGTQRKSRTKGIERLCCQNIAIQPPDLLLAIYIWCIYTRLAPHYLGTRPSNLGIFQHMGDLEALRRHLHAIQSAKTLPALSGLPHG